MDLANDGIPEEFGLVSIERHPPGYSHDRYAEERRRGLQTDRHRPGYWRDYHAKNRERRRPYLAAKARMRRAKEARG